MTRKIDICIENRFITHTSTNAKKNLDDRQNCTFNVDNFFFNDTKNGIHYRINMQKSASSLSMDSYTAHTTIPNKR